MLDLQKNNKAAQISAFLKERKYSSDEKEKYFHYFICLIKDKEASAWFVSLSYK